ncbi:hypothetical protein HYH03_000068 [Edaphochlamys debaryana]|uniref:Thioesterase domain-containing protein n=1 Tax=Edaphochlamys debaryana TaxID=47281 RepID=A0A835YII4_9CHLO|nr:hypothetical protein HYH03_000068 [Edaphochlamys debaryana]|eukprot:KAG2501561.1 hypothetical protein HYH03_000068 [Edaphochlamys debaryana]
MFNSPFGGMNALRSFRGPAPRIPPRPADGPRGMCVGPLSVNVGSALQFLAKSGVRFGGGGALLFAGAAYALAQSNRASEDADDRHIQDLSSERVPWVRQLAEGEGVEEVLSPGQQLRHHPIGKLVVEDDHLFETMVRSGQIRELRCFYDTRQQVFYSVVELGKEVCGFPQTVHGGLTAALVDETLGGLAVALWRSGGLGFRPPAYTARLEIDYKQKIPNGSIILIKTEVESVQDRKVWMRAQVTDGHKALYATGRALFVAPRWLPDWLKSLGLGREKGK